MFARISVFLTALLILAVPAVAQADKTPKVKPPKVFITLTDGAVNSNDRLAQPLLAGYTRPIELPSGKACKGKIAFSAPIGKKTVKKRGKKVKVTVFAKKSAAMALNLKGQCAAAATLSLPLTLENKKVKFTAKFNGNAVVKGFTKSKKLLVVKKVDPPAPVLPPTLKPGPWTITQVGAEDVPLQWGITIGAGNTMTKRIERYGAIAVHCPGPHADRVLDDAPSNEAPFDDPNVISTNPFAAVDQWTNPSDTEEHATQTFNVNFSSDTEGTGTFQVTGTLRATSLIAAAPDLVSGCASDVFNVQWRYGAAV